MYRKRPDEIAHFVMGFHAFVPTGDVDGAFAEIALNFLWSVVVLRSDLFRALKARDPRGLEGYAPFTGATPLWSTRKERGLFTLETAALAFFRMFSAQFRSECSLRSKGQLATPLGPPLTSPP